MKDTLILLPSKYTNSTFLEKVLLNIKTGQVYVREVRFKPISGSIYSKPSFAGSQVLLGIYQGKEKFSNNVWFAGALLTKQKVKELLKEIKELAR